MAHKDVAPMVEVSPGGGVSTLPGSSGLVPTPGRAAARAAGAGNGGAGAASAPADGVQLSGEADEVDGTEEERRLAEEQEEARRAQEQKERQLQELMEEVQKALEQGDFDKAGDLLRKVQELLGGEGTSPDPGSLPPAPAAPGGGAGAPASIPGGGAAPVAAPGGGGFPGGGVAPGGAPSGVGDSALAGQIDGEVKPPNGKVVPPLDNFRVTSEFGPRWGRQHSGIDLAAPAGTPIKAVMDGTVTRIANDPDGYGNWVEVRHSDGSTSRYAHMSAFGNVRQGQEIGAGTVIGAVGSTGRSTGPHLHFEWRKPDQVAVNPRGVFNWV